MPCSAITPSALAIRRPRRSGSYRRTRRAGSSAGGTPRASAVASALTVGARLARRGAPSRLLDGLVAGGRLVDRADHAGRVADGDDVRRQVPGHDRPSADDGVVADRHTGQHDDATTEPYVVTDGDRLRRLPLVATGAGLNGMGRGQQLDVRPDLHVVADGDRSDIERDEPEVGEAPSPEADLGAVVDEQRWPDRRPLPDRAEHLLEKHAAQRLLPRGRRVVGRHEVQRDRVGLGQLRVVEDVQVPGEHPLAHRSGVGIGVRAHVDERTHRCGGASTGDKSLAARRRDGRRHQLRAPLTGAGAVARSPGAPRPAESIGAVTITRSLLLFALAALAEIGGAWLVWQGVREHRGWIWIGAGMVALGLYGLVATLQPDANFGRILAAYGGVFVAGSLAWGMVVDGFRPDRYDVIGALVCLVGVAVIMYAPRT